jgi:hypothetical protein
VIGATSSNKKRLRETEIQRGPSILSEGMITRNVTASKRSMVTNLSLTREFFRPPLATTSQAAVGDSGYNCNCAAANAIAFPISIAIKALPVVVSVWSHGQRIQTGAFFRDDGSGSVCRVWSYIVLHSSRSSW